MKREDREDIRRRALARAEVAAHERLLQMRADLVAICDAIDHIGFAARPRIQAGPAADLFGSIIRFPRPPRGFR